MRIQFACLLLLSAPVLSVDATDSARYQKFRNQHIIGEMSINRCDQVMGSRGISKTDTSECKDRNTFILANSNTVKAICDRGGVREGTMTRSLQPFSIVVCTLRNEQARHPRCEYRGRAYTRYLVIGCEQGLPVHYDRDIVA